VTVDLDPVCLEYTRQPLLGLVPALWAQKEALSMFFFEYRLRGDRIDPWSGKLIGGRGSRVEAAMLATLWICRVLEGFRYAIGNF
jgi:hypothetical protein